MNALQVRTGVQRVLLQRKTGVVALRVPLRQVRSMASASGEGLDKTTPEEVS